MQLHKRKENQSPMSDEIIAKKKNTSKSALDETTTTNNTSTLSNDITDSTNTPKRNERRYQVCHEVLDTEENYVRVLRILLENFKKPLEARIRNGEERELLSQNDMNTLFHKIGKLFDVHSYILQNLRKNINDWQNSNLIGKIWADSFHDLQKCYPSYINGYDGILRTLDNLNSNRPAFHQFIKNAESNPDCQKNSIRDLLIRPVQRIPSVLLLMQELLKRTEKSNPDHPFVKEAIVNLKKVLEMTNEARRKTDNYQHFMEITNDIEDIPNEIISASTRHFIQSIDVVVISAGGILHKYKGKKIGLFLFNDIVEVAKARFCTSELNSTLGTSNGGGGLNSSFNSGSSTSTLNRQLSMGVLRRNASWKKQRQRYKHITLFRFANFRSIELEKEHEVFIVKIRDQKADELCFFKPINGYTLDCATDFFNNLVQAIISTSTREICLEEVTFKQIREQGHASPEDVETIAKALNIARELDKTGTISRRNSLRRSISSLSLGQWHPLMRMGSIKKPTLGDISES